MLGYLEKYNQLPPDLRQKFSSPEIMAAIKNLEGAYGVKLGTFVIKILVGDIKPEQGAQTLAADFNLSHEQANALMLDLKSRIFAANAPLASPRPSAAPAVANEALPPTLAVNELDAKLDKIMKSIKVEFASQDLADRFKKIIFSHLKGVRDKIATKEALVKEAASGGLGFDLNSAENIVRLINSQEPSGAIKRPVSWSQENARPIARDMEYDLAAAIKAKQAAAPAEKLLEPPVPSVLPRTQSRGVEGPVPAVIAEPVVNEVREPEITAPAPIEEVVSAKPIDNWRRTETGKIKMDDVLGAPKVFSPVDELKYMNVRNFRNLGPDPERATALIKQKISALAEEDYGKKIAGIQGWKSSPVNRMYVEVYQEAINAGKSVAVILAQKKKFNPEFITGEEFEAILTLNQDLKSMMH